MILIIINNNRNNDCTERVARCDTLKVYKGPGFLVSKETVVLRRWESEEKL